MSNALIDCFSTKSIGHKIIESDDSELLIEVMVCAKPGAKKQRIQVNGEGDIIVAVSDRPVDGAANKAISKFLAKGLGISPSQLQLAKGDKSSRKKFVIHYIFSDHKDINYFVDKFNNVFS